jgi:hypothetical protein
MELDVVYPQMLEYISGPVSWSFYSVLFDDKTYKNFHFFGDRHLGRDKTCESKGLDCASVLFPGKGQKCFDITYLLKYIFERAEKTKTIVDFFLEVPYVQSREEESFKFTDKEIGYIEDILSYFSDCFQYEKSKCKFKYTRFHYIDIRPAYENKIIRYKPTWTNIFILEPFQILFLNMEDYLKKDTLENKEAILNQIKVIYNNIIFLFDNIQKCFEAFLNPNFKESVEEIFYEYNNTSFNFKKDQIDYFTNNMLKYFGKSYPKKLPPTELSVGKLPPTESSVGKLPPTESIIYVQLEELKKDNLLVNGENISDLIKNYLIQIFEEEIQINHNKIVYIWETLNSQKSKDFKDYAKNTLKILEEVLMPKLNEYVILVDSIIMDAYTLPRMFRKYSSKKSNLSNYSITYAGNYHIKIYNRFFEQVLKLKPIVEKEGDPLRCIYEKDAGKYINLSYTPNSNFDMDDEFIEQYFASLQQ